MNPLLIMCEGIEIGSLDLPAFRLNRGEFLCLHLPSPVPVLEPLMGVLTGQRTVPGLHLFGRVLRADRLSFQTGWFPWFRPVRPADWLSQAAHLPKEKALAIVERLGLTPVIPLRSQPATPRTLLALEAAWASGADVVVFSTAGLDLQGCRHVYQAITSNLHQCAAMHLSCEFLSNGNMQRECFPGSICLPVHRLTPTAALTPSTPES